MKFCMILASLSAVSALEVFLDPEFVAAQQARIAAPEDLFAEFKVNFNRTYESEEIEATRFGHFMNSLERIELGNAERRENGDEETLGITRFSDMSPEEFKAQYLTLRPRTAAQIAATPVHDPTSCAACKLFPEMANYTDGDIDWVSKGAVTPVKDQKQCGSCWAFGTTGDIEGVTFLSTGKLPDLSEEELVQCDKGQDEGCQGGLPEDAFKYVIKNGLTSEQHYKYTSGSGKTGKCKRNKIKKPLTYIKGYASVSKSARTEAAIKTALAKNGPIVIGINAGPMQDYNSGIDNPKRCASKENDLDHAVLIVGYGTQGGKSYWKIKNSWNTDWGEKGYYRVVYGENKCGVAMDACHSHN